MSLIVYRSSAGSGKTYTLVSEYLRLILIEPQWFRHILAITFTNKAAQEMKERILTYLFKMSESGENPSSDIAALISKLSESCNICPAEIPQKARNALSQILHQYNSLSVGTIDSFMHQVVRSFAHDMGIPNGFEVELEEEILCSLAIDNLLERTGNEEDLTSLLLDYIRGKVSDDAVPQLERDLLAFSKILLKEDARMMSPLLAGYTLEHFGDLTRLLKKRMRDFEDQVLHLATQALSRINQAGFSSEDLFQKAKGVYGWFKKLSQKQFDEKPGAHANKSLLEDKWTTGNGPVSTELAALVDELRDIGHRMLSLYEEQGRQYFDDILVTRNLHHLALLGEIWKELRLIRDEQGRIPISDFNSLISAKVMGESVPYIYERLGQWYHHFMIDEFQDTSVLQWRNLLPLVENGLSEGFDVILVGDGKQSIYRWRNGEVEQFAALPHIFRKDEDPALARRERTLEAHYVGKDLLSNFRSSQHVVEFNNLFFEKVSGFISEDLRIIYAQEPQKHAGPKDPGRVEVHYFDPDLQLVEKKDFQLVKILEIVEKEEGIRGCLKGIAILCKTNKDAKNVSRFLLQHGKGVVSAEAIQLGSAVSVRAVISCMRYIYDSLSKFNRLTLLESLIATKLWQGEWSDLLTSSGIANHNVPEAFDSFLTRHNLNLNDPGLRRLPLIDLAEALIRILRMQNLADVHLQFMLDHVEAYARKESNNLIGFLQWWDQTGSKKSALIPSGIDAVQVMTIHKAKGLQFPVVICPFISDIKLRNGGSFWVKLDPMMYEGLRVAYIHGGEKTFERSSWSPLFEKEKARIALDHYNEYYVAFTRAIHRLYILCPDVKAKKSKTESSSVSKGIIKILQDFVDHGGLFSAEGSLHYYGELPKEEHPINQESMGQIAPAFTLFSAEWRNRLLIRTQLTESWTRDDDERPVFWGELVHQILSKVQGQEDIAPMVLKSGLNETVATELIQRLHTFISHPLIEPFFSPAASIKAEAGILMPDGHTLRPDRVLFLKDKTLVIDFKTGKALPSHQTQLRSYMDVLHRMGFPGLSGFIAYMDSPTRVVEVNG